MPVICRLCLSVCEHDNSGTVRDIITKFSGHHLMVIREAKFENGDMMVRSWWFNVSHVLLCKGGAPWRMTVKELTNMITAIERCAGSVSYDVYCKGKKVKERYSCYWFPSHSYGTPLAIWDYTVLPATRHKWTRPALTPASKLVLDLPTPDRRDGRLSW